MPAQSLTQLCPTLCDPTDCSLPGSSIHGIFQAGVLEWAAISFSKIDNQQEFALWLRKLKQGLCINLEGWDGEGDGREFQKGEDICISVADSC